MQFPWRRAADRRPSNCNSDRRRFPVLGQKLIEGVDVVISDPGQHVAKPAWDADEHRTGRGTAAIDASRIRQRLTCGALSALFFAGASGANLWLVCRLSNLGAGVSGGFRPLPRMFSVSRPFSFRLRRSFIELGLWSSRRKNTTYSAAACTHEASATPNATAQTVLAMRLIALHR